MLQWCLLDVIGAVVSPVRFNYWCGTGLWEHAWPVRPWSLGQPSLSLPRLKVKPRAEDGGTACWLSVHTKNEVLVPKTHTHTHTHLRAQETDAELTEQTMQSHTGHPTPGAARAPCTRRSQGRTGHGASHRGKRATATAKSAGAAVWRHTPCGMLTKRRARSPCCPRPSA